MSQPKTIKTGFKSPPLDSLKGRGPPAKKRKLSFFNRNLPQATIISYSLYGRANHCKKGKERFYMPPRYNQLALINFYRPCWDAHERGPPARQRKGPFFPPPPQNLKLNRLALVSAGSFFAPIGNHTRF